MNLPNKLTMLRILMVPVTVVCLLAFQGPGARWIALVLFVLASVTDLLDGMIARKKGWITDFGKFMDPLADKLLACSVLIALVALGEAPAWAVIVVTAREFAVSGFRLVAAGKNRVLAADRLGKRKANFQVFWIAALLMPVDAVWRRTVCEILMWIAVLLTIASFVSYVAKNKDVIEDM